MLRHTGESARDASSQAATRIGEVVSLAIEQRGIASIALSGGSSPLEMYRYLAGADLDWPLVHVFQVDERIVDLASPDRNWRTISVKLIGPTGAVGHPLTVGSGAASDSAVLRSVAGDPPVLDVVHLGLGRDGHTASWPPGRPVIRSEEPIAFVSEFNGHDRLTLTPRVVNAARHILWLVLGDDKRSVMEGMLAGDQSTPASLVVQDHAELFTDIALELR